MPDGRELAMKHVEMLQSVRINPDYKPLARMAFDRALTDEEQKVVTASLLAEIGLPTGA